MACIDILKEPRGAAYQQLIALVVEECTTFSLVWHEDWKCDPNVEQMLKPWLSGEERVSEWPGTQLLTGTALLRYYRLDSGSAAVLRAARHLYAWQQPQRPEDLACYTAAGMLFLGSIAHESDAWLEASAISVGTVRTRAPLLRVALREDVIIH